MIEPTQRRGLMAGMTEAEPVGDGLRDSPHDYRPPQEEVLDDDDLAQPNVPPEEQAAYERFVEAGFDLIYTDGKVNPGILQMLDEDPADLIAILGEEVADGFSPIIALAATAVVVVLEVVRRSPEKPEGDIILHGGRAILEDLASLAKEAKLHDFTNEDTEQALLHAVTLYRLTATQEGMVDNDALTEEFAEILNAQEEGRIADVLPGIERFG